MSGGMGGGWRRGQMGRRERLGWGYGEVGRNIGEGGEEVGDMRCE